MPISCRDRTSSSSSAIASACSPTAPISRPCASFFGDSIKGTAEFSYISIGLGMALGFLIGVISIPIPGVGTIQPRAVGCADRGAHPRHRRRTGRPELDHAALRQSRAAQPRAHGLSGAGRNGFRSQVRRDRRGDWLPDAGFGRGRPVRARRADSVVGPVRVPDAVRRGGGHRRRRLRQSGHPGLLEQAGADRASRTSATR